MHKVVIMNAAKMNYDGSMDFSKLSPDTVAYDDTTQAQFPGRCAGADAIVTKEMPVGADLIGSMPPSVRLIVEAGTGFNNIDTMAARERGITVCNIPAYSSERVAHTAIMLLLMLSSSMQRQVGMLARGDRSNFTRHLMVSHVEVNGKTLGVVGAGHIGSLTVRIGLAMGMKVLICQRHRGTDFGSAAEYVDFPTLLRESDYISLHCPLTAETRHLVGEKAIAQMKPTAFLINTARGALIDEAALTRALQERRIAGAGLDVQEQEPPRADSPLWTLDNVVLTPHIGWKGYETRQRLLGIIADDIHAFFEGKPINVVN